MREMFDGSFNFLFFLYIILNFIILIDILRGKIEKKSLWIPVLFFISGTPLLLWTLISIAFWGIQSEFLNIVYVMLCSINFLILSASVFFAYKLYCENKLQK
jgi:hypothetical protein